jgi:transketolase
MSKGHAAPILWAALSEAGAIKESPMTLRQWGSPLEGHPMPTLPWVSVATGSLGQGLSAACGMALAKRMDQLGGRVFCLMGDGEVAEGSVWEAAMFAATNKLSNLVGIVDVNALGQSGPTQFGHDVDAYAKRFAAFGWNAIVINGHSIKEIQDAFAKTRNATTPTMIVARTEKGFGSAMLAGKEGWHGKPLKKGSEVEQALKEIGDPQVKIPVEPRPYDLPTQPITGEVTKVQGSFTVEYPAGAEVATREAYGEALVKLGKINPFICAVDGDVKNSTFSEKFKKAFPGRFVEAYIAEQNMVGVALGLATQGKIPFASTFAAFLTRAYDFIRMAMYSAPPHLILCGSHAGVSIGEDGPSQMGLEDLAMFRALIDSIVLYPADGVASERLTEAAANARGLVYIRTSRPKTKVIYPNTETFPIGGSKTLRSSPSDRITIVSAGVTLFEALTAADKLKNMGINVRVIDAYSIKPIDQKTLLKAAQETKVLLTVEDHSPYGGLGEAVCSAVGNAARVEMIAVRGIPHSGKPQELLEHFGLSASAIERRVRELVKA